VNNQGQDEAVGPSCLVALIPVEDPLVVVDSLCGHAAHQVEAETDEEGPSVGSAEYGAVLVGQRGMACQGLRCVVVALFAST
jgi:hypothetical protein